MASSSEHRLELTAVDRASQVIKGVRGSVGGLTNAYVALAGAVTAALGAGGMAAFLSDAIRVRSALDDLSDTTGDNVRTLDGLRRQAYVSGLELEAMGGALTKLARNLNNADDEGQAAAQALKAIGLSVEQLRAMKPGDAMLEIARALDKFADGQGKVAVSMALFGKEGAKQLPFLKDLAQAGELHGRITAEQAAEAEKLEKEWRKLKLVFMDSKDPLASFLIHEISNLIELMREGIRIGGLFGAAIALYKYTPAAALFPPDRVIDLVNERNALEKMLAAAKPGDLGARNDALMSLAGVNQRLEIARFIERQEALAGRTGPQFLDARDLRALQKPLLDPGKLGGKDKQPDQAYENAIIELQKKLAGMQTGGNLFSEISAEMEAGKFAKRTEAERQYMLQLAARFEQQRDLRDFEKQQDEESPLLARESAEMDANKTRALIQQREHYLGLIDPLHEYARELDIINQLERVGRAGGGLTETEGAAARADVYRRLDEEAKKHKEVTDEITEFWKAAAQNMQGSMSDFFFDVMQGNLRDLGVKFKSTIDRMVADVLAAKAATALFGSDFGKAGGSIGGLVGKGLDWLGMGSALGAIGRGASASALETLGVGLMMGAQHGADWTVGGAGGTDSQLVAFRATPGERVVVQTPEQQRGAAVPSVTIVQQFTPGTDRRTVAHAAAEAGDIMQRVMRRDR